MEMIATSDTEYPSGIKRKRGERFEVKDAHVKILQAKNKARLYETRDMTASEPVAYETRDMVPAKRGRGRPRKNPIG